MMKTKEFIEKVEKMGFDIAYYKNPYSNEKSIFDYDLITIYLDDQDLVKIWTSCQYAISTISDGHLDYLYGYDVKELYKLCFEYANTPVKDREEEKKFYLKHRYFEIAGGGRGFFTIDKESELPFLKFMTSSDNYNQIFTLNETEEIKEKFDTDLSDFELVEVEE